MGQRFLYPPLDRASGGFPALVLDGTNSYIDFGSDASLDDVPSGATVTFELWTKLTGSNEDILFQKGAWTTAGYRFYVTGAGALSGTVYLATTNCGLSNLTNPQDSAWHHITFYYDDTTKKGRIAIDGAWGSLSAAGVGAYQADAATILAVGRIATISAWYIQGNVGWIRISDTDRYDGAGGTNFTPAGRGSYPTVDVNTVEQWNMDEGEGATAAAQVSSPTNDGTITSGSWTME